MTNADELQSVLTIVRNLYSYCPATGRFSRIHASKYFEVGTFAEVEHGNYYRLYLGRNPAPKWIYAHRAAWILSVGEVPTVVDHANGDGKDNRLCNLRGTSQSNNLANARIRTNNTSGFKGVSFRADRNKWRAQIKVNRKTIHLGNFDDPIDAHHAYAIAASKYYGEFARAA